VGDVSLEVHKAEDFGLLVPNGAGKTATVSLMLDALRPDRGAI
jgi:ABC-type multidrug transport system ATPase subunit